MIIPKWVPVASGPTVSWYLCPYSPRKLLNPDKALTYLEQKRSIRLVATDPLASGTAVFSQTIKYAIRAMIYIAAQPEVRVQSLQVAQALRIPPKYLSAILRTLSSAGLLASQRGPTGGFQLAAAPRDITLMKIVQPFERFDFETDCVLGHQQCSMSNPCPIHTRWKPIADSVKRFLEDTTLEQCRVTDASLLKD